MTMPPSRPPSAAHARWCESVVAVADCDCGAAAFNRGVDETIRWFERVFLASLVEPDGSAAPSGPAGASNGSWRLSGPLRVVQDVPGVGS